MAVLVTDLGGEKGFGENYLERNDDGYTDAVDITSVFPEGLNLFGQTWDHIYINNNGNITFYNGLYTYTPGIISAGTEPIIAPFWADVDTRGGEVEPGSGESIEPPHDLGTYRSYLETLEDSENALEEYYTEMDALASLSNASLDAYDLTSYYSFTQRAMDDGLLTEEQVNEYNFENYYNFLLFQKSQMDTGYNPDGNSKGSNLVWYDLDPESKIITVTWDDVGYYSYHTDKLNAFQLQLVNVGNGDFDMVFRYEDINWVTGDASDGINGLGGVVARAGYSAGDDQHYFELPISGNQTQMLDLENFQMGENTEPGVVRLSVRNGQIEGVGLENSDDRLEGGDADDFLDGRSGNDILFGGLGNDILNGGDGNDHIEGGEGNDIIYPGTGSDVIDGGDGIDTVSYTVTYNHVHISLDYDALMVTSENINDELHNIEIMQFEDVRMPDEVALTLRDQEAEIVRLYSGIFDRTPDNGGLEYWVRDRVENHHSIQEISSLFATSDEFEARFGVESDRDFINLLYNNILGRDADEAGFEYWEEEIARTGDRSGMVVSFTNSEEYIENMEEAVDTVLENMQFETSDTLGM